jgi:hypothetical protein
MWTPGVRSKLEGAPERSGAPHEEGAMTPPEVVSPKAPHDRPRSRRALLAGLIGGAGAWVAAAVGHPAATRAAAGDPLILGQTNSAGTAATRLNTSSSGGAFWMTQNGSGSGVLGESFHGNGGVFKSHHMNRAGLLVSNVASSRGSGAAIVANGGWNQGISAISDGATPIYATGFNITAAIVGMSPGGGVNGQAEDGIGTSGTSLNGTGVSGGSSHGYGVLGDSGDGDAGVYGHSTSNNGVYGFSEQGTGIHGRSDQGYAGVFGGPLFAQTYLEMPESVAPAAPDANSARLFVRDNGGKTQLCVLFPTGAVQVVATEP